ncbi:unnamed protein product [Cylindrotheca closterium]|uniref:Uncharacterized protein n=1 Tax=Cylindrotheca closterium TaxID=2856 RepID=A0AAD2FQW2_9STRA|nr:unnamed protein product [Cylindrotheca closterium]
MIRSGGMSSSSIPATQLLSQYHPVIIEGMGYYDPRDPKVVASHIYDQLQSHWLHHEQQHQQQEDQGIIGALPRHCRLEDANRKNEKKPKLVIAQGDPLNERGISAITAMVAEQHLGVKRGLVYLDPEIADYHSQNADRENVILEIKYSDMAGVLKETIGPNVMSDIESAVDALLDKKNSKRKLLNKPPLKSYFRDFALLQEVTKAACLQICGGDLTIAHTAKTISEFSVTSFYEVGLDLRLYAKDQMVPYDQFDELDFEQIDKR